jgi:hypothetical protein
MQMTTIKQCKVPTKPVQRLTTPRRSKSPFPGVDNVDTMTVELKILCQYQTLGIYSD